MAPGSPAGPPAAGAGVGEGAADGAASAHPGISVPPPRGGRRRDRKFARRRHRRERTGRGLFRGDAGGAAVAAAPRCARNRRGNGRRRGRYSGERRQRLRCPVRGIRTARGIAGACRLRPGPEGPPARGPRASSLPDQRGFLRVIHRRFLDRTVTGTPVDRVVDRRHGLHADGLRARHRRARLGTPGDCESEHSCQRESFHVWIDLHPWRIAAARGRPASRRDDGSGRPGSNLPVQTLLACLAAAREERCGYGRIRMRPGKYHFKTTRTRCVRSPAPHNISGTRFLARSIPGTGRRRGERRVMCDEW